MIRLKTILRELIKEEPASDKVFQKYPFAGPYEPPVDKMGSIIKKLPSWSRQYILKILNSPKHPAAPDWADELLAFCRAVDPHMGSDGGHLSFGYYVRLLNLPLDNTPFDDKVIHKEIEPGHTLSDLILVALKALDLRREIRRTDMFHSKDFVDRFSLSPEPNTPEENELLLHITSWYDSASDSSAAAFKKYYPNIQRMKVTYPEIFSPEVEGESGIVYRGIKPNLKFNLMFSKLPKDGWVATRSNELDGEWMMYTKPITYKPNRAAQSWSYKLSVAGNFSHSGILITKVNDAFFMNPDSSFTITGGEYEELETIHVGTKYKSDVLLLIPMDTYISVVAGKRPDEDFDYYDTEEIANEYIDGWNWGP